jgi:hypothetical protein
MAETPKQREYALEDIERGLTALALCGGRLRQASERSGVPEGTLRYWADTSHHERYLEITTQVAGKVEDVIVQEARETASLAAQLERSALEAAQAQIDAGQAKDPSQVAQRASTVKGINVDKLLQLTGRPTHIVENRTADELLRKLGTALPGLIVEGTATEIPTDAEQIEQSTTAPLPSAIRRERPH